jgi:hypothetical protein
MTPSRQIMKNNILGALLAACVTGASAQQAAGDLVILPAPSSSWRTIVGHWEHQAELAGDGVVVPAPSAEYARGSHLGASTRLSNGVQEALLLDWKHLWHAALRIESRQPLNLRPYMGGTLEFDLNVAELSQGGVKVKVACGDGCERAVNLMEPARGGAGKGWQRVTLAMSCFMREGADFSRVSLPFALEGTGSGRVSVANVRITRHPQPGLPCPDYRTESVTPAMLDESWAIDWWLPRHEKKL